MREEEEERASTPVVYEAEPRREIEGVTNHPKRGQEGAMTNSMEFENVMEEQEPELVLASPTGFHDDYYNRFVIAEPPTPELIVLFDSEEEEYEPMDTEEEEYLEKDLEEDPEE